MPEYTLHVNGAERTVEAPADMPLLWVLRDLLGVTGPKYGCGVGVCGACTSHLDGNAVRPCITPVAAVGSQAITTIEGLADGDELHPIQQAWIDEDVAAWLLEEAHVATVAGTPFGAPGYLRFSYACAEEDIEAGIGAIRRAVGQARG